MLKVEGLKSSEVKRLKSLEVEVECVCWKTRVKDCCDAPPNAFFLLSYIPSQALRNSAVRTSCSQARLHLLQCRE